jgi:putative PIN family toxin of toxin-antitoxin system
MGCYAGAMLRVVLDTSVVASALRSSRGASFALLRAVRSRLLIPLATTALYLEYEDVLKRSDQREASMLSLADIDDILAILAAAIEPVDVHIRWRPQLRDPSDEMVFEAAINGRADALVTHNIRDFREAGPRFGIRIARPAEVLMEIA